MRTKNNNNNNNNASKSERRNASVVISVRVGVVSLFFPCWAVRTLNCFQCSIIRSLFIYSHLSIHLLAFTLIPRPFFCACVTNARHDNKKNLIFFSCPRFPKAHSLVSRLHTRRVNSFSLNISAHHWDLFAFKSETVPRTNQISTYLK